VSVRSRFASVDNCKDPDGLRWKNDNDDDNDDDDDERSSKYSVAGSSE
jgi:hypothetical protein